MKNTGTKTVTIASAKINGGANIPVSDVSMAPGNSTSLDLDLVWTLGNPYKFDLYDATGTVVGSYQATPPS